MPYSRQYPGLDALIEQLDDGTSSFGKSSFGTSSLGFSGIQEIFFELSSKIEYSGQKKEQGQKF